MDLLTKGHVKVIGVSKGIFGIHKIFYFTDRGSEFIAEHSLVSSILNILYYCFKSYDTYHLRLGGW